MHLGGHFSGYFSVLNVPAPIRRADRARRRASPSVTALRATPSPTRPTRPPPSHSNQPRQRPRSFHL
eukprot:6206800-Pleurochrysis_carterae.AAC.3